MAVTLTAGTAGYLGGNKSHVAVYLTDHDKRQIKLREELALDERFRNTFLSYPEGTLLDTSGNPVGGIPLDSAVISFDLDLNVGTLTLYYSDHVSHGHDNYDPTQLTLHDMNLKIDTTNRYNLVGGSTTTPDGYFTAFSSQIKTSMR